MPDKILVMNGAALKEKYKDGMRAVLHAVRDLIAADKRRGPHFYGQRGKNYPVAMASADVSAGTKRNTIIAAECCYGAQLFDPQQADNVLPICNSYLEAGAIAFLGSTTIAYGDSDGNSAADLLTQDFIINALSGASFVRAFLQARQKFVQTQKMEDPVNVKTHWRSSSCWPIHRYNHAKMSAHRRKRIRTSSTFAPPARPDESRLSRPVSRRPIARASLG